MYFSKIPNVYAPYTIGGVEQYIQIKDITVNVRFVAEFLSNITVYDLYDIRDGETPEILAENFYGTPIIGQLCWQMIGMTISMTFP